MRKHGKAGTNPFWTTLVLYLKLHKQTSFFHHITTTCSRCREMRFRLFALATRRHIPGVGESELGVSFVVIHVANGRNVIRDEDSEMVRDGRLLSEGVMSITIGVQ